MFTIHYHPKVRDDFRKVHPRQIGMIREIIDSKLASEPETYGKPLRRTLKNLRSLRIGNYRVVYTIQNKKLTVLVLIVGRRDKVYKEAKKRM